MKDPVQEETKEKIYKASRVFRGGSWSNHADKHAPSHRGAHFAKNSYPNIGFRPVRSSKEKP